ncbi:hypothetical protein CK516_05570 [Nostoc sp. 'Peltigera malacea cyanobiont' DB3992]|nr:hypothetical protein CK516_05570 [Nostoc sp. 'Peltigera malacea cyanobiont' DB3992]
MGGHWVMLTVAGFIIAGIIGLGMWWVYVRLLQLGQRRAQGGVSKRMWSHARLWGFQSQKDYELLQRHEV